MDKILEITNSIALFTGYVFLFFIVMGIFSLVINKNKRKSVSKWDYEVRFPKISEEDIGRGKVEIESNNKGTSTIESWFELEPEYRNKAVEIYSENTLIQTISAEKNTSKRVKKTSEHSLVNPGEGSIVTVKIENKQVFSGRLYLD